MFRTRERLGRDDATNHLLALAQFHRFSCAQPGLEAARIPQLANVDRWHNLHCVTICGTKQGSDAGAMNDGIWSKRSCSDSRRIMGVTEVTWDALCPMLTSVCAFGISNFQTKRIRDAENSHLSFRRSAREARGAHPGRFHALCIARRPLSRRG